MLEVSRVTKLYRRAGGVIRAVDGVSLALKENEVLGLVGRSGSGKTTLGMIICGAMRPTSGEVRPAEGGRRLRAQMIFQDPRESLNPRMKVRELVAEPLAVQRKPPGSIEERAVRALEEVQLEANLLQRYPHELSGGQRQRVAIARALIAHPDLVIADEPTSMLDATVSAEVIGLLKKLIEAERMTFVFITHDLAQAAEICDRIGVMSEGKLVELGEASQVCVAPRNEEARELLHAARVRQAALTASASTTPAPPRRGGCSASRSTGSSRTQR